MPFTCEIAPVPGTEGPGGIALSNKTRFMFRITSGEFLTQFTPGFGTSPEVWLYEFRFDIRHPDSNASLYSRWVYWKSSYSSEPLALVNPLDGETITPEYIAAGSWIPFLSATNTLFNFPLGGTYNIIISARVGWRTYDFTYPNWGWVSGENMLTTTGTATLASYTPPRITSAMAIRCKQDGAESSLGNYLAVRASWEYDDLGGVNTASASFVWGVASGSMSQPIPLQDSVWSAPTGGSLSPSVNYVVIVTVIDALSNSVSNTIFLNSLATTIDFPVDGNGLGIGKDVTRPGVVDFAWPISLDNEMTIIGEPYTQVGSTAGSLNAITFRDASGKVCAAMFVQSGSGFAYTEIPENLRVAGMAILFGGASVNGNMQVFGNVNISGTLTVGGTQIAP
jgi:hypothetical protein